MNCDWSFFLLSDLSRRLLMEKAKKASTGSWMFNRFFFISQTMSEGAPLCINDKKNSFHERKVKSLTSSIYSLKSRAFVLLSEPWMWREEIGFDKLKWIRLRRSFHFLEASLCSRLGETRPENNEPKLSDAGWEFLSEVFFFTCHLQKRRLRLRKIVRFLVFLLI